MSHILEPTLEVERLVLVTIQLIQPPYSETAFQEALPKAYRFIELTKEFLEQKEKEQEIENERYWNSEEGKKRKAEVERRFSSLRERKETK